MIQKITGQTNNTKNVVLRYAKGRSIRIMNAESPQDSANPSSMCLEILRVSRYSSLFWTSWSCCRPRIFTLGLLDISCPPLDTPVDHPDRSQDFPHWLIHREHFQ